MHRARGTVADERDQTQRQADTLFKQVAVAENYVVASDASNLSVDLYVDGITCAAFVWLAESALAPVPGVTAATANQVTHRASVRWQAGGK